MSRPKSIQDGVKYTVVLPESDIRHLKELAKQRKISSINEGVREAVEAYLVKQQAEEYKQQLQDAMKDPDFRRRNDEVEDGFKHADAEMGGKLEEW